LYSRAVEYYSGMNDEKYLYFTERIQNMLCRPDILKLMSQQQNDITLIHQEEKKKSASSPKNERRKKGPPEIAGATIYKSDKEKAE